MASWAPLMDLGVFLASEALYQYGTGGLVRGGLAPQRPPAIAPDPAGRQALARAEEMEARVGKLTLACLAMWSLLKDTRQFTEEALLERIKQIDLMDGKLDGKIGTKVKRCPRCNRVMSARHGRCLYCGAEDLKHTAMDAVS